MYACYTVFPVKIWYIRLTILLKCSQERVKRKTAKIDAKIDAIDVRYKFLRLLRYN